jgi:SP family sugar:H+ symporter-like MFS transporter
LLACYSTAVRRYFPLSRQPLTSPDDGSLISGLQAFDAWHEDLGNPDGIGIGLLNASGAISGFVVGPIITYIDETFGRKWGIRCGWRETPVCGDPSADDPSLWLHHPHRLGHRLYCRSIGRQRICPWVDRPSLLCTPVHNADIAVFITGRVIIGFGLASFLMTSLVVVQEITHPRSRSTVAQSWVSDLL